MREACPWGALEKVSEPKAKICKIFEEDLTNRNIVNNQNDSSKY
jgi:hypothetical protein